MTHALNIATGATPGQRYIPSPVPADSLLGKFLAHALPDEGVRALVQEQCGMTLLPGSYQIAAWWHGAAAAARARWPSAWKASTTKWLAWTRHSGRHVCARRHPRQPADPVDEVECEKWKEGTFKTLVSGNGIGINRKHLSVLNYHSKAKWIISSNSAPFYRDKSGGVARRLSIVEWANVIPEKTAWRTSVVSCWRKKVSCSSIGCSKAHAESWPAVASWPTTSSRRPHVLTSRLSSTTPIPSPHGPTPTGCCSVPPLAVSNGKASRPSMPAMWLVREEGL